MVVCGRVCVIGGILVVAMRVLSADAADSGRRPRR